MKKFSSIIEYTGYSLIAAFFVFGCEKKEAEKASPAKPEIILTDRRDAPVIHLYSDTVYILTSNISRKQGQELVIDEGTLIKVVSAVSRPDVGSITIEPGAIIRANGTRNNPVVITSNEYPGTQRNNWQGIRITGKARNNTRGTAGDSSDFSGSLTFLRIEFGSLTLDAVGSKTVVENVMVSYTNRADQQQPESAFKILGGSFNAKNLVSYSCGGPADFFITDGYNGKIQNMLAYRNVLFGATSFSPANTLAGVLISNSEYGDATARPATFPVISNLTVLGPSNLKGAADAYTNTSGSIRSAALVTESNALFSIRNSLFLGFPRGGIFVNDSLTAKNIERSIAVISYSYFSASDSSRTFLLPADAYPPNTSYTLAYVLQNSSLNNKNFVVAENTISDFGFVNPFNYNNPGLLPKDGSPVLNGADFSGSLYNNFFDPVTYKGAIGKDNWLSGWTNFTPLKTNYNFPDYKPF